LKRRRPRRLGCRDLPRVSVMMVWIANCQQRRREAFQTATRCSLNCSRDGANSLLFFDPLTNIPLDEARAWPATSPSCLNGYSALVAPRPPSREQKVSSVDILPTATMPMTPRDTATALMRMALAVPSRCVDLWRLGSHGHMRPAIHHMRTRKARRRRTAAVAFSTSAM
jgi:hypothetical protein